MNETERILALEDALIELRKIRMEASYRCGVVLPGEPQYRLAVICADLDRLTDDMRNAEMGDQAPDFWTDPGDPVRRAEGYDANGSWVE